MTAAPSVPPVRAAERPRLLVLSHVLPFPGHSGQQQRVFYTLRAARRAFDVTFATFVPERLVERTEREMSGLCDDLALLPSRYGAGRLTRLWYRGAGAAYALATGLKFSNYLIGRVELEPSRVLALVERGRFDCVLFEYFHASAAAAAVRARGVPCVLDMHNVLWKAYAMQLDARPGPKPLKERMLREYRRREEEAWRRFDAVVAINEEELAYVRSVLGAGAHAFYAPMGIDLAVWPYGWEPSRPPRVAFYGSLASPHNQRYAESCAREVMPRVWARHPDAELWLVGNAPSERVRALAADPRVTVTGFVEEVRPLLATMSAVVCPWVGRYGFRSRLVELMALGVPVVASPDAVAGMELRDGVELLLGADEAGLAGGLDRLLSDGAEARALSLRARRKVESRYSNEDTYDRLVLELQGWLRGRADTGRARAAAH